MTRITSILLTTLFIITLFVQSTNSMADEGSLPNKPIADLERPSPTVTNKPLVTPAPPILNAKAYILIDVNSGKIIAEKNSEERLPPASLTKMMTLYVISNALHHEQIHLADNVRVSRDAWKIGGSRMFIKEGQQVAVEDLLKGIIVDSGNDACVAMAEHVGGTENSFTDLMNQQAQNLGMKNSHFTDSTGLPDPNLYTTAKDLAILGRALIIDFPQYYDWYKQKWFTYNGIRQPNRNRLLWRDNQVDGIKTGHTNEAGFCLVSSAKRDNMRLLAVVLGEPSDSSRADDSEKLLNYGFRFFETHQLYKSGQSISELPLYKGQVDKVNVGLNEDQYITIPTGQYQRLNISTKVPSFLEAPIKKGDKIGDLVVQFDNNVVSTRPLYALQDVESGGFYTRSKDSIRLAFKRWFGS
ncbi:D-alanyl-D-alanine carboxypeptidase family protein [Legionella anisa]|nr:D-alanyl-D-alanine carboxypeptidase family protein [Legionella anisa]KTC71909.1 D-alanyl-D-alanine carboxypeptidase (penicillin-binding protein 5) [Legionella anisa]MBN5935441.1 D-alanyl-D-alanine carboxypeptidase [Legionella anisa]MCW8425493.1 D-alanyl-D-alanine carboxypeptidase [Legionella anisa]MCW8449076.1 D-alanyl-D-alanine carboxypeptidase [Legionella anisa]UAK79555.1 D-alanyl-D-alanine carboxypeptidase [Legionella anisa]